MRYLSPAWLFGGTFPPSLDKKTLILERKKLLAELELSGDTIEINGASFSKNDIIDYFEALQSDDILAWHKAIADDPTLRTFLEKERIDESASFKKNEYYQDPAFIQWISPYFYQAFTHYVTDTCFRQNNTAGLSTILQQPLLMTEQDQEHAWSDLHVLLESNISRMDYFHHQSEKKGERISVTPGDIEPILSYQYIQQIIQLPETHFGMLRDKYAFAVMQAAIYAFNRNTKDRTRAMNWIDNAESLAVTESVQKALTDKHAEMKKLERKRNNALIFRVIWIAVVLVQVIRGWTDSSSNGDIVRSTSRVTFLDSAQQDSLNKGLKIHPNNLFPKNTQDTPHVQRLSDSLRTNIDTIKTSLSR